MKLSFHKVSLSALKVDVAVAFIHQDASLLKSELNALNKAFKNKLTPFLHSGDFKGKESESVILYLDGTAGSNRIVLVGLGEKKNLSLEKYRRAAALGAKKARSLRAHIVGFEVPAASREKADSLFALAEGASLSLYRYDKYISKKKEDEPRIWELMFCSNDTSLTTMAPKILGKAQILCEATSLARDLQNAPANEIYPETLAKAARDCAEKNGFTATVMDEYEIKELGMGGVIGVSQGSAKPPRFRGRTKRDG